ncbi:MAG: sugar porter family MFS transporter [Balneolia bacterium]|nr:sugar porter family MFS transporter [Balneolia bacterium]
MTDKQFYVIRVALIVALGGFLMGFDASVISGVVRYIGPEFGLSSLQIGWAVGSLTLTSTLAMLFAGPLSDRFGRRGILKAAAVLFAISAIGSALATDFTTFVIARMIGGFGVGAALIIAPMYIAEIAPPKSRGRLVSFNQLNIVVGISAAFFSNYLILQWSQSDAVWVQSVLMDEHAWRWMLGVETIPAVLYFVGLMYVPQSPRWQMMKGMRNEARNTLNLVFEEADTERQLDDVERSLEADKTREKVSLKEIFHPALRYVLLIGVTLAILQQITGINAVFFYAPMIFEQSGIGADASFMQAVLVGLTNLAFTIVAILLIDKLGRRPLLIGGMAGITLMMMLLAYGFGSATYEVSDESLQTTELPVEARELLAGMHGISYSNDVAFKNALIETLGDETAAQFQSELIIAAIDINPRLILFAILGFVASFAVSIGPVMWVMFSELFPLRVRGLAISFAGFINSGVSFLVQLVFPWELATLGNSLTFLIYGLFAAAGLFFIWKVVPETKNKSLEELEDQLVTKDS